MHVGFKCGLEIWKVSQSGAVLGSFSARSLLIDFINSLPAKIKEGIATRACGAESCFSSEAISVAGLVFCKGVCTIISDNSGMGFYLIKEDVRLRITDSIRKNFEDFSLDMVTVLLLVQQVFPSLMECGQAVCGNMNMIVCNSSSYSCQFCSPYGVGYTSTVWFNDIRVARAGVVDTCLNNCYAFLDVADTIRVGPGCPVIYLSVSPGLK